MRRKWIFSFSQWSTLTFCYRIDKRSIVRTVDPRINRFRSSPSDSTWPMSNDSSFNVNAFFLPFRFFDSRKNEHDAACSDSSFLRCDSNSYTIMYKYHVIFVIFPNFSSMVRLQFFHFLHLFGLLSFKDRQLFQTRLERCAIESEKTRGETSSRSTRLATGNARRFIFRFSIWDWLEIFSRWRSEIVVSIDRRDSI